MCIRDSVGPAAKRFEEDGLRVLRAVRFAVTKRLCLDAELKLCLHEASWWDFVVKTVSAERIREELAKMFKFSTIGTLQFMVHNVSARSFILFGEEGPGIWLKPTMEKK